ncbi:MAG: HD domain-containing protein [Candidatus Magasanikiibacteriota bacterium]
MYTIEQYFKIQEAIKFLFQSFAIVDNPDKPELVHSLHTGFRLMDYGYGVDLAIAGFLHDVVEEGGDLEKIKDSFGEKVFEIVAASSKDVSLGDWPEQYVELISRAAASGEDTLIVKAVDILDNFYYMFETDNELGKKKVMFLAEQLFKYTSSEDKVFGDLRNIYNEKI